MATCAKISGTNAKRAMLRKNAAAAQNPSLKFSSAYADGTVVTVTDILHLGFVEPLPSFAYFLYPRAVASK